MVWNMYIYTHTSTYAGMQVFERFFLKPVKVFPLLKSEKGA